MCIVTTEGLHKNNPWLLIYFEGNFQGKAAEAMLNGVGLIGIEGHSGKS